MNVNNKKNGKRKEPSELKNLDNDKEKKSRNRILRTELVVRYFFVHGIWFSFSTCCATDVMHAVRMFVVVVFFCLVNGK